MRKAIVVMALGAMGIAGSPHAGLAHPGDAPRVVLAVLAHPDDELVFAPALAAEARSGSLVRIVYATSGDAGPGVSEFERGEALADAREKEAQCAADALGAKGVDFLHYGDGTLANRPHDRNSPAKQLLPVLEDAILQWKPEIVITWGPDGGYGHGDHRMVSSLVTQVLQERTGEERPKLYYPALVNGPLPDILQAQGWATTAPELAAVRYSYSDADLAAASSAAQCHATQFDAQTRAGFAAGFHALVWKGEVAFREAF